MHPPCSGSAQDDGGFSIEAEALELRVAVLAVGRDLAHPNLVAHHLNGLLARYGIPG